MRWNDSACADHACPDHSNRPVLPMSENRLADTEITRPYFHNPLTNTMPAYAIAGTTPVTTGSASAPVLFAGMTSEPLTRGSPIPASLDAATDRDRQPAFPDETTKASYMPTR